MPSRDKILLLDDDQDLLEMYREILAMMPSKPEIFTATAGGRALALLDSEPFSLFICDLKMPKMDGLQVLSIVRRKHPQLRTVVLTSVPDEHFRSRAYALGVDLFWQKPSTEPEIKMFLDCLESLLERDGGTGFRGMQSKSLVDILQLENLAQSSSLLKITNGSQTGKIWLREGEVVDADLGDLTGEPAFQKILSWKTGAFETLPAEPDRPQTIFKATQGLLLETAQALDEAAGADQSVPTHGGKAVESDSVLSRLARHPGVEFVLTIPAADDNPLGESWGIDNAKQMAAWSRQTLDRFRGLGDQLRAGHLEQTVGRGPQRHVSLAPGKDHGLCVGWNHTQSAPHIRDTMKKILTQWLA